MRRADREITDLNEISAILADCKTMRLGLCDGDKPYVVPLNFGFTLVDGNFTFYFHSALEGRKLDLIAGNPNVCVEFDCGHRLVEGKEACDYGFIYQSVIAEGKAELLSDSAEKIIGLKSLMKQQTGRDFEFGEKEAAIVAVGKITVTALSAKARKF